MKIRIMISFALFFSTSFSPFFSTSMGPTTSIARADSENECEGGSQVETAECIGTALNVADQELTQVFKSHRARLAETAKTDRDAARDAIEIERRLVKSQRIWTSYRQAECSFEGVDMLRGNGEPSRIKACELEKTRERLSQLRDVPF